MNKNKLGKVTGVGAAAFLIAGTTAFTAFAAMPTGTAVIGDKAFDLNYLNDPANVDEITAAMQAANFKVYVKGFDGAWIDNATETELKDLAAIPAVEYKNAKGEATNYDAKDGDVTEAAGELKVNSVSAINANSLKVVFNKAVEDTSKVSFNVKNSGTVVVTTTTWNDAKTEATLTTSYKLPQATYTIDVKNDSTDLGTNNVEITQQQVKKIDITSSVLAIDPTTGKGYITYKVYDQYGTDITDTTLGNNISWTPGIGSLLSAKNGTIVIGQNGVPLTSYTSAVINGYDTNNYVTTSATLSVSQSAGTLSAITLNSLTSPNNDDLNAGNASGLWYLDFSAVDASGNQTTDYTLIDAGIQTVNVGAFLTLAGGSSNGVEQDPTDSTKACIPVKINTANAATLAADTQIPITILTTSGKSSTLTVTLKKAAALNNLTLSAPSQSVASGETVTIPFIAYDQNGTELTKYTDLVNPDGTKKVNLTLSGGAGGNIDIVRNADGTASIQATMPTVTTPTGSLTVYINSNVILTGKASSLTISVQQPKTADGLDVDSTEVIPYMQAGAVQYVDFGYSYGGFTLKDQYGRAIDLTNQNKTTTGTYYFVRPSVTSGGTLLSATGDAYGSNKTTLTAATGVSGTATVKYDVYKSVAGVESATGISRTATYTILKDSDIVDYSIDTIADPIKMIDAAKLNSIAIADVDGTKTEDVRDTEYSACPEVWGKTSGGAKVVLAASTVKAVSIDNSDDFAIEDQDTAGTNSTLTDAAAEFTSFPVYAKTPSDTTITSASTNLTVTVVDSTGNYRNLTTTIKSSRTEAKPASIGFSASNAAGNTGISTVGNTITVSGAKASDCGSAFATTFGNINGKVLTRYDLNGATDARSAIYFYAKDQYGTKAAPITLVSVTDYKFGVSTKAAPGTVTATVTSDSQGFKLNIANGGAPAAAADISNGDYIVLSAVTANGQIQTIKIVFNPTL